MKIKFHVEKKKGTVNSKNGRVGKCSLGSHTLDDRAQMMMAGAQQLTCALQATSSAVLERQRAVGFDC